MPRTLEKSVKTYSPEKKAGNIPEPPRPGLNSQERGFIRLNPTTSDTRMCGAVSAMMLDPS